MNISLRRLSAALATAALAMTMAGCSTDEAPNDAGTASPPTTAAPSAEETTEPTPLPDPEHGDTITAEQAADLPEGLVAVEIGDGTLIAVNGTQVFPEPVVAHLQDLIPTEPITDYDMDDVESNYDAGDVLREELLAIAEATGRRGVTVVNYGMHDEEGNLTSENAWSAQLHSELTELLMAKQAEGVYDAVTFHASPQDAIAQLEGLIYELQDPSVWEIIPPRP